MNKLPVSVFIIARDEADRIGRAIGSVSGWADEVIVVDSGSADDTVKIAEGCGARVMFHEWQGYGPQKRFAEEQCKNRWLLNLDADEIVSPALAREIQELFQNGMEAHAGYMLRVCHMLPGEKSPPVFTQVNACLRLYDKTKGRFSDSPVHDSVILNEGSVGHLQNPVHHPSYRSLAHAVEKINRYSTMQADDMIARGQKAGAGRLYIEFFIAFFKAYFIRLYLFRGRRGFSYAMVYAFSRFLRLAKWHEEIHRRSKR